jgi:hypothetical protein
MATFFEIEMDSGTNEMVPARNLEYLPRVGEVVQLHSARLGNRTTDELDQWGKTPMFKVVEVRHSVGPKGSSVIIKVKHTWLARSSIVFKCKDIEFSFQNPIFKPAAGDTIRDDTGEIDYKVLNVVIYSEDYMEVELEETSNLSVK